VVDALITLGANVDHETTPGMTALQMAGLTGDVQIIKQLLARGANINYQSRKHGTTALHMAARCGQVWGIHALARHRVRPSGGGESNNHKPNKVPALDLNLQSFTGATALVEAAMHSRWAAVAALVKLGARIDLESNEGRTAFYYARELNRPDMFRLMEHKLHGGPVGPEALKLIQQEDWKRRQERLDRMDSLLLGNSFEQMLVAIKTGTADVDHETKVGFTPLLRASLYGRLKTVQKLLR
jgi:ankyrin repeat protein